jgi:hypothetical protein
MPESSQLQANATNDSPESAPPYQAPGWGYARTISAEVHNVNQFFLLLCELPDHADYSQVR